MFVKKLQSLARPNVTPKNLFFMLLLPPFPPIQCCRLVAAGTLAENSASHCFKHSLINIEWGNRGDCRNVTLILSTFVATDCRPGPASLLKMDFFKVVNTWQASFRISIFQHLSMAVSATNLWISWISLFLQAWRLNYYISLAGAKKLVV